MTETKKCGDCRHKEHCDTTSELYGVPKYRAGCKYFVEKKIDNLAGRCAESIAKAKDSLHEMTVAVENYSIGRSSVGAYINDIMKQEENFIFGVIEDYLTEQGYHTRISINGATIKAMVEKQIKLKECIANLDNPEFQHLSWSHEELLKLLKEHVV